MNALEARPARARWFGRPVRPIASTSRRSATRLQAELARARTEVALLNEELSIKNDRMGRVPPRRRPHVGDYHDEASFRSWLFAAVLNVVRNRVRFHAAARRAAAREDAGDVELGAQYASLASPSEAAIASERAAQIEQAFDELPEQYREVITLSRIAGLPNSQIAPLLGKTEANVRMLLSRALARLASLLS